MSHKCPKDGCGIDMPDHLKGATEQLAEALAELKEALLLEFRIALKRQVARAKAAFECLNRMP